MRHANLLTFLIKFSSSKACCLLNIYGLWPNHLLFFQRRCWHEGEPTEKLDRTQLPTPIQRMILRKLQGVSSIWGNTVSQENLNGDIDGRLIQFVVDIHNWIKCQTSGWESKKILSKWVMGPISRDGFTVPCARAARFQAEELDWRNRVGEHQRPGAGEDLRGCILSQAHYDSTLWHCKPLVLVKVQSRNVIIPCPGPTLCSNPSGMTYSGGRWWLFRFVF